MDRLPPALATATRLHSLLVELSRTGVWGTAVVTAPELDSLLAALPGLREFGLGGNLPPPVRERLEALPPHIARLPTKSRW